MQLMFLSTGNTTEICRLWVSTHGYNVDVKKPGAKSVESADLVYSVAKVHCDPLSQWALGHIYTEKVLCGDHTFTIMNERQVS